MKFSLFEKLILIMLGLCVIGLASLLFIFLTFTPIPKEFPVVAIYFYKVASFLFAGFGIFLIVVAFKRN